MQLTRSQGQFIQCLPDGAVTSTLACKVVLQKGERAVVRVRGQAGSVQHFMISFYRS